MKIVKALILFCLIVSYVTSYSQEIKMNKNVEEMIALGKDSIVQLALSKVDKKIHKEDYTKVKLLTNGEEILVYFSTPIEYFPEDDMFYFGAKINLLGNKVHYSRLHFKGAFKKLSYSQTKEAKKKVLFVLKAINDPRYSGSIDIVGFDDNMSIWEYEFYYGVNTMNSSVEGDCKVDKVSGEVYECGHNAIAQDPDPLPFENINDFKEVDWGKD